MLRASRMLSAIALDVVIRLRPISWLPRISMALTIAQLSERLRCAECGGQVQSVKPWRLEDVLGKPLRRRG